MADNGLGQVGLMSFRRQNRSPKNRRGVGEQEVTDNSSQADFDGMFAQTGDLPQVSQGARVTTPEFDDAETARLNAFDDKQPADSSGISNDAMLGIFGAVGDQLMDQKRNRIAQADAATSGFISGSSLDSFDKAAGVPLHEKILKLHAANEKIKERDRVAAERNRNSAVLRSGKV